MPVAHLIKSWSVKTTFCSEELTILRTPSDSFLPGRSRKEGVPGGTSRKPGVPVTAPPSEKRWRWREGTERQEHKWKKSISASENLKLFLFFFFFFYERRHTVKFWVVLRKNATSRDMKLERDSLNPKKKRGSRKRSERECCRQSSYSRCFSEYRLPLGRLGSRWRKRYWSAGFSIFSNCLKTHSRIL
jgi:hypothetical protein